MHYRSVRKMLAVLMSLALVQPVCPMGQKIDSVLTTLQGYKTWCATVALVGLAGFGAWKWYCKKYYVPVQHKEEQPDNSDENNQAQKPGEALVHCAISPELKATTRQEKDGQSQNKKKKTGLFPIVKHREKRHRKKALQKVMAPSLFASFSRQGQRTIHKKNNEDTIIAPVALDNGCVVLGVCDGHNGNTVANVIKEQLPRRLNDSLQDKEVTLQTVSEAFTGVFKQLDRDSAAQKLLGGATAACALIYRNEKDEITLFTAHVGNSRIVVGRQSAEDTGSCAVFQTVDHTLENKKEQDRITAAGCVVSRKKKNPAPHEVNKLFLYDDTMSESTDWSGPLYMSWYNKQLDRARSMNSRSIGDYQLKELNDSALIATPECSSFALLPGDIIIIATDGIWGKVPEKRRTSEAMVISLFEKIKKQPDLSADVLNNIAEDNAISGVFRTNDDASIILVQVK